MKSIAFGTTDPSFTHNITIDLILSPLFLSTTFCCNFLQFFLLNSFRFKPLFFVFYLKCFFFRVFNPFFWFELKYLFFGFLINTSFHMILNPDLFAHNVYTFSMMFCHDNIQRFDTWYLKLDSFKTKQN